MAALLKDSYVTALLGMNDTERTLYLQFIATAEKASVDDVRKAFADASEKVAARAEGERKANLRNVLKSDIEAFRLGTEDGHDFAMLDEMRGRAIELGAVVTFTGLVDGTPRFSISVEGKPEAKPENGANTAARGGGTGAGRPAADAPQPFTTPDGSKRVVGPLTLWLKANVSADILKAKGLMKDDGSLKGSGSAIATAAVKAGLIVASPVPPATPAPAATADSPALPGA